MNTRKLEFMRAEPIRIAEHDEYLLVRVRVNRPTYAFTSRSACFADDVLRVTENPATETPTHDDASACTETFLERSDLEECPIKCIEHHGLDIRSDLVASFELRHCAEVDHPLTRLTRAVKAWSCDIAHHDEIISSPRDLDDVGPHTHREPPSIRDER